MATAERWRSCENVTYAWPHGMSRLWTYKYPSGQIKSEEAWYLDRREGEYIEYYENGNIKTKGNYVKGNKSGNWQYFDENGVLIETKKNYGE